MKGRPIGKRVSRKPKRRYAVRRKTGAGQSIRQDRKLLQLVVAGGIFVVLVVMKLFAPESVAGLGAQLRDGLDQNADFRAAFSAVGEAIAGEKEMGDSLKDAYTAVFSPEEYHAAQAVAVLALGEGIEMPTLRLRSRIPRQEAGEKEELVEQAEELMISDQSLIYFGAAAPANVSFEQAALGFSYTTPAQGKLTSPFGYREHPVYGEDRFHYGLDIAAGRGTEICAFAGGTVKATGESSSLGKYLMLSHPGGYTTLYAHCDRVTVSAGREVAAGEKIAEMGDSGIATGTHLHFELLKGDTYLNPIYYVEVY